MELGIESGTYFTDFNYDLLLSGQKAVIQISMSILPTIALSLPLKVLIGFARLPRLIKALGNGLISRCYHSHKNSELFSEHDDN